MNRIEEIPYKLSGGVMCYINCSLDYEVIDDFGKILENIITRSKF